MSYVFLYLYLPLLSFKNKQITKPLWDPCKFRHTRGNRINYCRREKRFNVYQGK